jgi:hypothetical protein
MRRGIFKFISILMAGVVLFQNNIFISPFRYFKENNFATRRVKVIENSVQPMGLFSGIENLGFSKQQWEVIKAGATLAGHFGLQPEKILASCRPMGKLWPSFFARRLWPSPVLMAGSIAVSVIGGQGEGLLVGLPIAALTLGFSISVAAAGLAERDKIKGLLCSGR